MSKIVYMLRLMEFENGGVSTNETKLFNTKADAQTEFKSEVTRLKGQYANTYNESDTHLVGYDETENYDFVLDLTTIPINGLTPTEGEMMDVVIENVSGGSLNVLKEIAIDLGDENYEKCDEMVLLGVLKEYVKEDEDSETEVTYNVHLALHFKDTHDVLNYAINIECVAMPILQRLYEYVMEL